MIIELDGHAVFVGQGGTTWQPGLPTLVLMHGAGMDRTVWVLLARYLARHGYNVVAPDLPQHGASAGKTLPDIESMATWLWQLLDALRKDHSLSDAPPVLAGHSMGALICVAAAAQRPAAAQRLMLLGVGYPMRVGQALLDAAAANSQTAVDMITIYSHSYASRLGHNTLPGISVQNMAAVLLERTAPGVLHNDLQACHGFVIADSAHNALRQVPAVIIAGDEDRMSPMKASRELARLIDSPIDGVPDCGHMMMSEQPELTLQAMLRALA